MTDLTPRGLDERASDVTIACRHTQTGCPECDPLGALSSGACTTCILAAFTTLLAEAQEHECPREHSGLERAMMKVMGGTPALPDGELGQDVAALCFGYERMIKRKVAEARREQREFCTLDHPMANGRTPTWGDTEWVFTFPLEDGQILTVRCGEIGRNALISMAHEEKTDDVLSAALRAQQETP